MNILRLEELSVEQKIGQLLTCRGFRSEEDKEFVYDMIRKRSLGGIQVSMNRPDYKEILAKVKDLADYPILICADMEVGLPKGEYKIPSYASLGVAGDEELAYQVGAVTAIEAKKMGYNTVWGPVVDMIEGNCMCKVPRVLGCEPEFVGKMAAAVVRGYLDNGMFATAKHWGATPHNKMDSHMFKDNSTATEEELLNNEIIPYLYAAKHAGLTGIMTGHTLNEKIDPVYPTTLSEKTISILRNAGFDGLILTDSFAMVGVLNQFGEENCYGFAIKAGNDMVLPNYRTDFKTAYEYLMQAYRKGVFDEQRLNEAVARVIKAQNQTMKKASAEVVSDYQKACFERIEKDSIFAHSPSGKPLALDKESKKLFVIVTENIYLNENDETYEIADKTSINSKNLPSVKESILSRFPGSNIVVINQLPNFHQVQEVCANALDADDVIFITFVSTCGYCAGENLTEQIINTMLSLKEKVAAVIHLGNPYAAEKVPHSDRYVFSVGVGMNCIDNTLAVLNGEYVPKGKWFTNLDLR